MSATGLLNPTARLLLRAISRSGPEAVAAYSEWRSSGTLDAAHGESHQALPLLVEMIAREGLTDPDLARMRGAARQVWTYNVLRLRLLFDALDALESRGIRAILMKGAALFARAPELERRRIAADYDILVLPEDMPDAVSVLRERDFLPFSHWEDFGGPSIDSVYPGLEIKRGAWRGLDLHWRPLWNIRDPALGKRYALGAGPAELHGRQVYVPAAAHQLFCAMARCEPWDRIECFSRITEGYLLLTSVGKDVDWNEFLALTRQYGLECVAQTYLETLQTDAGIAVPSSVMDGLAQSVDADKVREWRIRTMLPNQRSSAEHIVLQRQDFAFGRSGHDIRPPGQFEERLRSFTLPRPMMHALWNAARQRLAHCPMSDAPVFLEGFSAPEAPGRWTVGKWALVVLPLTEAQRRGEPLRLNAYGYGGRGTRARILATGGRGTAGCTFVDRDSEAILAVRLRPLPELGDRGLLLLWLPDAAVPADAAESGDKRQLGLFLRRQWDRRAAEQAGRPPISFAALRRMWRLLPLPKGLRQKLSPGLSGAVRQTMFRKLPPLHDASTVRPGNVVVSGYFSDVSGIGRAGRLTLDMVSRWPVSVVPHDLRLDPSGETIAATDGGVWICHCNAPEAIHAMLLANARIWAGRYRIGIWAYELERLPPDWVPALSQFHEIWAPSEFVAGAVRDACGNAGPIVRVVPHPFPAVDADLPPRVFRKDGPFSFLIMFDTRSTWARKNPMGAIRAFQSAFDRQSRSARLVIKVVEADSDAGALAEIMRAIAGWPNISLVTRHFSDSQTLALIAEADCLLSLYRSEGFGLTVAEAMSVGTPSIITDWSAPTEFTSGAALAVGCRLVPAIDPSGRYGGTTARWAEPDEAAAAADMLRLSTDEALWTRLSQTGIARAAERRAATWPATPYKPYLDT